MLRGIDISNWQRGIDLDRCDVDFVVVKATGGTQYVDPTCDEYVQKCVELGKLWGFYHFAKDGYPLSDGRAEADFFVNNCHNYFLHGVPVLDLEDAAIPDWRGFATAFVTRVHELTGVWPIVYTGLKGCNELADSLVSEHCGFWFAGYPQGYIHHWIDDSNVHSFYSIPETCNVVMWQFTSALNMAGMNIDANYAYMDAQQWGMYAKGDSEAPAKPEPTPEPSLDDLDNALNTIAEYVWKGYFGNGDVRKDAIYEAVQKKVNARA